MKIIFEATIGEILNSLISITAIISTICFSYYTIKENDRISAQTYRAFVFPDKANLSITPADNNDGVIIFLPLKNFGATPALNVVATIGSAEAAVLPTNFDFPDQENTKDSSHDNIPAGAVMSSPHKHFSQKDLKELFISKRKLYTWGWIEYNDIFTDDRHRTEFCFEMTVSSKPPQWEIQQNLCNKFNEVDKASMKLPKPY